jgi:hypothetical protein
MFHRFPFDLRVMSCTHWKVAADTRHKGVGLIAEPLLLPVRGHGKLPIHGHEIPH